MELKLQGIKCASIMINFLKGNTWPEFDHKVAYAIKSIEIGTYSYRLIHEKCKFVTNTIGKIEFDIDAQYYTKNPNIKAYTSQQAALIHNFQLMIKSYKTMKQNIDHVRKAHQTGSLLRQNLKTMEESIYNKSQKMVQDFEASKLLRPTNPNYEYYSNLFTRTNSIDEINISTDGAIGTSISNPAENCLRVIVINRSALSGFYWIKPDCALKPIKVWCDFSSYGDAVDILITSGERIEINPDLSEWNIRDYKTIQKKCAELGLYPIQIRSSDVISRIVDLAEFLNYDLTLPQVIPLGYDYFCDTSGCSGQFSSLDSEDSKPINSYFPEKDKDDANVKKKMSGIGFNHLKSMKIFDPIDTKITAIVCSTNISKPAHEEPQVEVDCDRTVTGHTDQFPSNNNVLINCDASCNLSPVEVYGDGVYDGKSSICKAAIHDGKITINGGKVNISVRDAMPDNAQFMTLVGAASQKNGIQSRKDVKNDGSFPFSFINYTPACPIDNFLDTHEKELDIKIKKDLGDSFLEMNENLLKDVNIDDLTEDELKTIFVKGKPMSYYKKLRDEMVSDPDNFRFSEEQFKPLDVPGKGGKKGLSELTANKPNMDKAVNQLKGNAENGLKNLMGQASQGAETSMSALQKGLQNTISETNKGVANAQYGMDQLSGAAVAAAKNMALDKVSQGVKQNWSEWGKMGKGLGNISFDDQVAIRRKIEQQDEGQNEENKPKKDGKDCTPTTDQGFEIIQEIFKASDYNMLNELENDRKKVEETIASFGKELAWTNKANGSSNFALKCNT